MAPTKLEKIAFGKFTDEEIADIRSKRAERDENGKVVWTHMALAEHYKCKAGTISQIVRNRSYCDPDYVPINDRNETPPDLAERLAERQAKAEVAAKRKADRIAARERIAANKAEKAAKAEERAKAKAEKEAADAAKKQAAE